MGAYMQGSDDDADFVLSGFRRAADANTVMLASVQQQQQPRSEPEPEETPVERRVREQEEAERSAHCLCFLDSIAAVLVLLRPWLPCLIGLVPTVYSALHG